MTVTLKVVRHLTAASSSGVLPQFRSNHRGADRAGDIKRYWHRARSRLSRAMQGRRSTLTMTTPLLSSVSVPEATLSVTVIEACQRPHREARPLIFSAVFRCRQRRDRVDRHRCTG